MKQCSMPPCSICLHRDPPRQREAPGGSTALAIPAYLVLLAILVTWLISLGFGLRRLQRTAGEAYPDEALGARAGDGAKRDVPRSALGAKT